MSCLVGLILMQVVVVEVRLGVVGVPVFYPLSLCLDVLLAGYSVVWYSTLATTIFFVGY